MEVKSGKNHVGLNFINDDPKAKGLEIDFSIKIDKQLKKLVENIPPTKNPFLIQLTLNAKPGEAEKLSRTLEKLLNPKKRFRPIPQVFYYAIREKHIQVKVTRDKNQVNLTLEPGEKFLPVAEMFLQTFREYGFENIGDHGFDVNFKYQSKYQPKDIIKRHILNFKAGKGQFFRAFFEGADVSLDYGEDTKSTATIDAFFDLALKNRHIPHFAFFDNIHVDGDVDLDSVDFNAKMSKNSLFTTVNNFCKSAVDFFSKYTERELKQIVKLKALLESKIEKEMSVKFIIPDLVCMNMDIDGEKIFEILEFLAMHPTQKSRCDQFYDKWILAKSSMKEN